MGVCCKKGGNENKESNIRIPLYYNEDMGEDLPNENTPILTKNEIFAIRSALLKSSNEKVNV